MALWGCSLRELESQETVVPVSISKTLLPGGRRRLVALLPLLTASRVQLLPSGGHFSPRLASVEAEAGTNTTYDPELTVTGAVHRQPGMCSKVVITSPLYTVH